MEPQCFISPIYSHPRGVGHAHHTRPLGACIWEQGEQPWTVEAGFASIKRKCEFPDSCRRMCLGLLSNSTDGEGTETCYLEVIRNCAWSPKRGGLARRTLSEGTEWGGAIVFRLFEALQVL